MGQRLNIEIIDNEKSLANCYYHWSGYSTTSLQLTKQIISYVNENPYNNSANINDKEKYAIEALKTTGADYPGIDRNNGLIGVTEEEKAATREWEEGRITVNVASKTFRFNCAYFNDYIDYDDIWQRVEDLFYPITELENPYKIPFDKVDYLLECIKVAEKDYEGRFVIGYSSGSSIY